MNRQLNFSTGNLIKTALAAGTALVLLAGCGQEKKETEETAFDPVDPLSLPLGDNQVQQQKYNANIPPIDELKKQYKDWEKKHKAELEPKRRYAYNKLYTPFTHYPQQQIALPQPPKTEVFFARAPEGDENTKVAVLTTQEPVEQVEAFYADKLKKDGWVPVAMKGNTAYHEVVAVKGKRQLTVTIYIDLYKDERVIRIENKQKRNAPV